MTTIRVPEQFYRELRESLGPDACPPEVAFARGAHSHLEQPRVSKLSLERTPEERLDELMLMLTQTKAAYGVLKIWEAAEGKDYAAGREEYTALAEELERLQAKASRLKDDVESLAREVARLEAGLRDRGGDPGLVGPPFPRSVTRPPLETSRPGPKRGGLLVRLWRRVSGSEGG
jgi:cell division protein FtsB